MSAKVSIEETGEVSRAIKILIPRGQYDDKFSIGIDRAAQGAKIKGFRPGKAPKKVIEKLYGDRIQNDVLEELVSEAYRTALTEHKLNVVGYPKIDIKPMEEGKDVEVSATVELYPTPEIKDYKKLSVECEVAEFEDSLLEAELSRVTEMFATSQKVEGRDKVKEGDLLKLSYTGEIDGQPFEGSDATDVSVLLGSGGFPEEFEKAVVGAKVGAEKTAEVPMPKEIANPAIAGKTASYKITVSEISERVIPELTDEFVKEKEIAENVDELKTRLRKTIDRDLERKNRQSKVEGYFKTLLDKTEFEIPQILIDEEIRSVLFEARLLDPSDKKSYQISVESFRETLGEQALFRVKQGVALEKITELEKVEVEQSDIDSWLAKEAEQSSVTVEEIEKAYDLPKSLDKLKSHLVREKTLDIVLADCKIKAKKAEKEDSKEKKKTTKKKKDKDKE